jgi:hypothetical protein
MNWVSRIKQVNDKHQKNEITSVLCLSGNHQLVINRSTRLGPSNLMSSRTEFLTLRKNLAFSAKFNKRYKKSVRFIMFVKK